MIYTKQLPVKVHGQAEKLRIKDAGYIVFLISLRGNLRLHGIELHLAEWTGCAEEIGIPFLGIGQLLLTEIQGETLIHRNGRPSTTGRFGRPWDTLYAGNLHQLIKEDWWEGLVELNYLTGPNCMTSIVCGYLQVIETKDNSFLYVFKPNILIEHLDEVLYLNARIVSHIKWGQLPIDGSSKFKVLFQMMVHIAEGAETSAAEAHDVQALCFGEAQVTGTRGKKQLKGEGAERHWSAATEFFYVHQFYPQRFEDEAS